MRARIVSIALSIALLAAVFAVAVATREYRYAHLPEPEHCALCGREYVCHAPAL